MRHKTLFTIGFISATTIFFAGCQVRTSTDVLKRTSNMALWEGNYQDAAQGYQELTDRQPGNWLWQYRLGISELSLEKLTKARRSLEIANTLRPNDREIIEALAEAMFRQGDKDHLMTMLQEEAQATQSIDMYMLLGDYLMEMGDPDSASTAYSTAIVLDDGRNIGPYLKASSFAEQLGDREMAVRRLRQAYGIEPGNEEVCNRLTALGEIPGPSQSLPPGR